MISPLVRRVVPVVTIAAGVIALTSVAGARRIAPRPPQPPVVVSEATYTFELVGEDGGTLQTFRRGGRVYILGDQGDRYSIRVTNPTAQRIEALVSVDGLDVIDGRTASLTKRGYIVMPFSSVEIDGFRVSTEEVAAFRFSTVADSYAGRKGKARNVGVIGLAVFEEKTAQPIALPRPGDWRGRDKADRPEPSARSTGSAEARPAEPSDGLQRRAETERSGLGTAFGENRTSVVSFTTFERIHPRRPQARAELRYNDASGLRALGIRIEPSVDVAEIELREGADPFPEDDRFATPPPR